MKVCGFGTITDRLLAAVLAHSDDYLPSWATVTAAGHSQLEGTRVTSDK